MYDRHHQHSFIHYSSVLYYRYDDERVLSTLMYTLHACTVRDRHFSRQLPDSRLTVPRFSSDCPPSAEATYSDERAGRAYGALGDAWRGVGRA